MCGEKDIIPKYASHNLGSPPHVRGKETAVKGVIPLNGITPACAGKSIVPDTAVVCHQDHPRMCGEKC